MSKQEESITKASAISRRFITCTQSTGRVGKSTVAEGLITWMRYAGIDFAAVDADSEHQTLSRRYPEDSAIFEATKTFDGFARMLNELPAFPLIIVDFLLLRD
jgi:cellulose biosynthesis protein BcsQ